LSGVVVDASLVLAWCFPDESNDYADAVLDALDGVTVNVPSIWPVEVTNALAVGERSKRIMPVDVLRFEQLIRALSIVENSQTVIENITNLLPLAREYKLTAYDAAYLDLSARLGVPLATLDNALQKAARDAGINLFKP
jgi:predicted nucleic acid-binding protein